MSETQYADFLDEKTGAHARITATDLVIFTGPDAPGEYGMQTQYPLRDIRQVMPMNLPGGQTAIALIVEDAPKSPGLTFAEPQTAEDFQKALMRAVASAGQSEPT